LDTVVPLDALRIKAAEAREAFERAAAASFLQDDPAKDQLLAMGLAMDTMVQICEISEAGQRNLTSTLDSKIGEIAQKATEQVVERSGPQMATAIERSTRFHLKTVRLRTILGGVAALLAVVVVGGCLTFGTGYAAGRIQGEIVGNTTNAAMRFGPKAAAAWSLLMANNDPVSALASCKKSTASDADGRQYCPMPVWIEPPQPVNTTQ
jgi:hypothetical protein